MRKKLLLFGGLFALLAVILGAFGAHGLKALITTEQLQTFHTGVKYQFYHSFALILMGLLLHLPYFVDNKFIHRAGFFFIIGIFLFSGSVYLLATRDVIGLTNWKWLGPITPLGGLTFIIGWISFIIGVSKSK